MTEEICAIVSLDDQPPRQIIVTATSVCAEFAALKRYVELPVIEAEE